METIGIVGLYLIMVTAILAGALLLWSMIMELVHFDARANRARSPASPPPPPLVVLAAPRSPPSARGGRQAPTHVASTAPPARPGSPRLWSFLKGRGRAHVASLPS